MKAIKRIALSLLMLLLPACSLLRQPVKSPSSGDVVVSVWANSSLQPWLDKAALEFNTDRNRTSTGKPMYVNVSYVEAGQAVANMSVTPKDAPALWLPDSEAWVDVAVGRTVAGFTVNTCTSTAQSPLVIGMWRSVSEALGYPSRTLGWLDMSSLTSDPQSWLYYSGGQFGKSFRFAHAHPGLSGAGVGALLAVVQAAKANGQPIAPTDAKQPILQASVTAFESGVALFGPSSQALGKLMRERGVGYLNAVVLYESTIAMLNKNNQNNSDDIIAVYPFEGTFVATHPACINAASSTETREAAAQFRDYLLKPEVQTWAVDTGLRAVTPLTKVSVLKSVDLNQPKVAYEKPQTGAIESLQTMWQASKKPINLVMVLDTSGSMGGEKIDSLRTAAVKFVEQMNTEDHLSLVTFASDIRTPINAQKIATARNSAISAIRSLNASGNTLLYDAIGTGAEVISKTKSSQRTNVMIVLSDGLDTGSRRYKFDANLINVASQYNTSVWTIAYGGDADKERMSQLARDTNGSYFLGSTANIASIYQEMSTAFGGSAGIGR
jgi:Ca-activated chloride channel family protein